MRRTAFDVPLALFVIAAGLGVFVAYDRSAAWPKFIVILAGVALYYALVFLPRHAGGMETTRVIFALAPAVVFVYFLLSADLSYRLGKIPAIDPLMRMVMALQPRIGLPEMNTNTLGGLMAVLLPLQVYALFPNLTGLEDLSGLRSRRLALMGAALLLFSLFALVLSASRAGWLSLVVVALFWLLHRIARIVLNRRAVPPPAPPRGRGERNSPPPGGGVGGGGVAPTLCALLALLLILAGAWLRFGNRIAVAVGNERAPVWSAGFQLATDTPITGLGLAGFTMPFSSYTWLIHVPYLTHAHNLYLDLWLEMGLLGVFAFGMMVVMAFRAPMPTGRHAGLPLQPNGSWRAASLAAISIMLLHGLLDDPLFAYGLPGQVFLWLPFVAMAREADVQYLPVKVPLAVTGAAFVIGALVIAFVSPAQAIWQANLGALAQTRIELSDYRNDKWGLQDSLRRSSAIDLTPALQRYQQALALDPTNATANRRLGQIELAQGQYDSAASHLKVAYAMTPGFRASRQLFGEALAIAGETDAAVDLWRSIDAAQGQLQQRLDWYRYLKDDMRAARIDAVLQRVQQ